MFIDVFLLFHVYSYQLDALKMAMEQNTIVYLETGSGKTLIAIMLLHSYAHLLRKPSSFIVVFLVPTAVLVSQVSENCGLICLDFIICDLFSFIINYE